jgi:hypothetical protein
VHFDSDKDGLPDLWEMPVAQGGGYTHTNGEFVDLYGLGARKDRKDIFVEIGYLSGITPPDQTGLDLVVAAFANAPVDAPNGIMLHYFVDDAVTFDSA